MGLRSAESQGALGVSRAPSHWLIVRQGRAATPGSQRKPGVSGPPVLRIRAGTVLFTGLFFFFF